MDDKIEWIISILNLELGTWRAWEYNQLLVLNLCDLFSRRVNRSWCPVCYLAQLLQCDSVVFSTVEDEVCSPTEASRSKWARWYLAMIRPWIGQADRRNWQENRWDRTIPIALTWWIDVLWRKWTNEPVAFCKRNNDYLLNIRFAHWRLTTTLRLPRKFG